MDAGAPAPASGVRKRRRGGRVGKIDIEDVSFAYEDVAAGGRPTAPAPSACRALREHEMAALREAADELEELVPQTYWPMPDYCELLFDL